MAGISFDRRGVGPPVVLVHGVGIGPWSYAALAVDLARDHEVVVAHRRGYGDSAGLPLADSLDTHVHDLVTLAGGPAAFVGVSGGATLVLALALAHPELVSAAVVHEPLIGPLAPALHTQVGAAASRLAETGDVTEFVRSLVGPATWVGLDMARIADVAAHADVVRAEVPLFLAFAPTPDGLRSLTASVCGSVGAVSPDSRQAAAAAVAAHTGRSPVVLPGVGHLAQLEGHAALAGALRALEGGANGDEQILATRRGDQLQPDR